MFDLKTIRQDPDAFVKAAKRRDLDIDIQHLLHLDEKRREIITVEQNFQSKHNKLNQSFAERKRLKQPTDALLMEIKDLEQNKGDLSEQIRTIDDEIKQFLEVIPNVLDLSVPDGTNEKDNVCVKTIGNPLILDWAHEHFDLGESLKMMNFELATRMSGSRFTILSGSLARLERALGQFMLDLHTTEHGYTETQVPLLVNDRAAWGTDKLPKFADDLFKTTDGRWLIPTGEVPLTCLAMDQIFSNEQLPVRLTTLSECFRKEAGSAGKDTRGMLRQHQFKKVELVSIVHPDLSETEHERMTVCAETVLSKLGLTYRRMLLCAGDTGFGAAKTYDLEVWLPGQKTWREISSCSNTKSFQAKRLNARFSGRDKKVIGNVHTLNGSGVAVGRALIAVMETYQQKDGSVQIPEALYPYMGNIKAIERL